VSIGRSCHRQHNPLTDRDCLKSTKSSLARIGRVLQNKTSASDGRMKLHLILAAERHPEPRQVILTARIWLRSTSSFVPQITRRKPLASHYALQRLQDGIGQICMIRKRKVFCAVVNWHPGSLAQEFVGRCLVWILKNVPNGSRHRQELPVVVFSRGDILE